MNDVTRTNLEGHDSRVSAARDNADFAGTSPARHRRVSAFRARRHFAALLSATLWLASGCDPTVVDPTSPDAAVAGAAAGRSAAGAPGVVAGSSSVAGSAGLPPSHVNDPWFPMMSVVPSAPPVACGKLYCPPPTNPVGDLLRHAIGLPAVPNAVACCLDEATGTCGSAASIDAPCEGPPVADPKCPGIDLSALAALVGGLGKNAPNDDAGCCTHDACGIDGVIFGRGCVENDEMRRILGSVPVVGPLIAVPAATTCESPIATPKPNEDAGTGIDPDADAGL